MESPSAYIPMDRRQAIARNQPLSEVMQGAALFADISGFTPLTETLLKALGPRRGADELTHQLNRVYNALIDEVHRYRGSVLTFSGDAITCWFDENPNTPQAGLRAAACGLAMQQAMKQFATIETPDGRTVSLGMKAALATGQVRRFLIGDPQIQRLDVLAGSTLDRMADAEHHAERGEVVLDPEAITHLETQVTVAQWRPEAADSSPYAVISGLTDPLEPSPWPPLVASEPDEDQISWQGLTEAQARPWLLPPIYERVRSGQGDFLAEIRPAVILFLRFGGLDYDDDEAAGDKLDAYIRWVQNVMARHKGYLFQLTIGDKGSYIYGAFGAPLTYGDEPARAVATALELQPLPADLDFISDVQIGISQGRVRAGAYGGLARRTYGVLGDEVNLAARLMSQAEPGQIMISQDIAVATATAYRLEFIGEIKLKGKAEPLPAYHVLGQRRASAQRPVNTFPTPLLGRETELARMEQILSAASGGEGQILRVEGAAGIGKSHLQARFAERALNQNWEVVIGVCQSTGQNIPYHPWREVFRALFDLYGNEDSAEAVARQIEQVRDTIQAIDPDWLIRLPLLGDLLDLPIPDNDTTAAFDPQLRQEALFSLAIELVQTWVAAQPLLLLIEDIHWLDEASQGLTLALGRVVSQMPVALVLAQRPPIDENKAILPALNQLPGYQFLNLGELSPAGVGAIVTNRLKGPPSALLLDIIQTQARGNPFFVEELVDALREFGHLVRQDDQSWGLSPAIIAALQEAHCLTRNEAGQLTLNHKVPLSAADLNLPDSIHGLVLSRLDRLLEAHKLTLKVASVIGRIFEFQLLARSHPVESDEAELLEQIEIIEEREFARLEMPLPKLAHIFKHNITRDVAYETLLEAQQRQLHRVVAEALESLAPEAVEQLAYHYSRGKVRRKALIYLDKAARKAQREYANETALNYYTQALALEERWEWQRGRVELLHILGRRGEEKAGLEQLEAYPATPEFEAAYLWSQYFEAIGDYPQAQTATQRALNAAQKNDDAFNKARCLAQLGVIMHRQGAYDQAIDWYDQALTLLQKQEPPAAKEAKTLAGILNGLGIIHRQQGDFAQARSRHEQALALSRQSNNRQSEAQAFNDLGVATFYQRHFAEALTFHQQAVDIRRSIGDRVGEGKSLYNMSMVTRDAGDYSQTQEYLAAALKILQATGNRWDEVNVWNELGILHQELGKLSQAREDLEQGLQVCREIGDEIGEAYLMANLGLVAYTDGDLATAELVLRQGIAIAEKHNDKHILSYLLSYRSSVSLQRGKLSEAIEQANATLTLHRAGNNLLMTADDLSTLAEIYLTTGDTDRALDYAQQALTILNGCNGKGPEFPHRDYFICYQVLAAAGQTGADAALQNAYELVMARAEKITDPALQRSFLERVAINREIVAVYNGDATGSS